MLRRVLQEARESLRLHHCSRFRGGLEFVDSDGAGMESESGQTEPCVNVVASRTALWFLGSGLSCLQPEPKHEALVELLVTMPMGFLLRI